MDVDQRGLGGGQHKFPVGAGRILDPINLVTKFRELARHIAALISQHVGRQNKLITVLDMLVDKEIKERPFQTGAPAPVQPGAGSGDFCAPLVVDHPQAFAKLHVVFRLIVKLRLLLKIADRLVLLLAAGTNVLVRQVGQGKQQILLLFLQLRQFRVALLDFRGKRLHTLHQGGRVFSRLFQLGDLFAVRVLLRFFAFHLAGQLTALFVNVQNFIHDGIQIHFPFADSLLYLFSIGTNHFNV